MAGGASPTLKRRELGFLLRQLRTDRGLSVEEVTERLLFSATKISRLETGRAGASPRDIRDLCNLYEVTDPEREQLMALAREGKQRGWWEPYALPYATYVGLETEATSISDYRSDGVAGLIQIEDYARAIHEAAVQPLDRATIEQRVEARLKRQEILARADGPQVHIIMDEAALLRPVGGSAVMRDQLNRLIEVSQLPRLTLQVMPLAVGAHPGISAAFTVLLFDDPKVNDVVYLESQIDNHCLEKEADVEIYRNLFSRLRDMAADPQASRNLIAEVASRNYDLRH